MKRNRSKAPRFDDFNPSSCTSSRVMRGNRYKDTSAELLLRSELWKCGLRYRLHVRSLPGKPDIVLKRQQVAVFVDGDFWHGRNWKKRKYKLEHGTNSNYWVKKIKYNIDRDQLVDKELKQRGWLVIRLWENDIRNNLKQSVGKVLLSLKRRATEE